MQPSHLCAAIHKLVCRHSSSSLDERQPTVFHGKTSAGDPDNCTVSRDATIATSLPQCFLSKVVGFSRGTFSRRLCCVTVLLLPVTALMMALIELVGGVVFECRGGKKNLI